MDLILKAKGYELEAIDVINDNSIEIYKGKNSGFHWALHEVNCNKAEIDFHEVAKLKLDKYYDGVGYEERVGINTHLTADEEEFKELFDFVKEYFNLIKLQKSYLMRIVIKYAVLQLHNEKNSVESCEDMNVQLEEKQLLIEEFKKLDTDQKLVRLYELLLDSGRK